MQTLHVCPTFETFSDFLPALASVCQDSLGEFFVFAFSPVTFDFDVWAGKVLLLLILGWPSFVEMWIQLLMSDQILLSLLEVGESDMLIKFIVNLHV